MVKMRNRVRIPGYFWIIAFSLLLISCGGTHLVHIPVVHKTPLEPVAERTLMAWGVNVDITPPPGIPLAGFSSFSCKAKGVRNKIMAHIIYIKPMEGKPVALVQCDLLSGSLLVHHKVGELIADQTDVELSGLVMAGSHTHSAPGNYFGADFYNMNASNKMGFDQKLYEFFSTRIAEGIIEAYKHRKPARIGSGGIEIYGLTANRSFPAYMQNKDLDRTKPIDKFSAINPLMHIIRIDCLDNDGIYKPLAAFVNFSIHPNTNPIDLGGVYNGDVSAYVERLTANRISKRYNLSWEPVYAAANATHADTNPWYGKGVDEDFSDLYRLGNEISEKAFECFTKMDGNLKDNGKIEYSVKELDIFENNTFERITVAKNPKVGWPTLGGAQGRGRQNILSYFPPIAPGCPRIIFTHGEQGHKRPALGPLQYLLNPRKSFPHLLFLQVLRIGDTVIMALPWEITNHLGKRISDEAKKEGELLNWDAKSFIVMSCSNDYWGYVTTPEEYQVQWYEGSSNLYGPHTGDFIKAHMVDMVKRLAKGEASHQLSDKWLFSLKAREYFPKDSGNKKDTVMKRRMHSNPIFYSLKKEEESFWSFKWYDVGPWDIELHSPLVSVEVSKDNTEWKPLLLDGVPVNDSGLDIAITCEKKKTKYKMGLYNVKWYNLPARDGNYYRFVFQPRLNLAVFYSPSFMW